MNYHNSDPFIIIRSEYLSQNIDENPEIKLRKPTKFSWTQQQNYLYVTFLRENMEAMESKEQRKNLKVFSLMAKKVKTRTSTQIKSHHQKLQRKFGSIQEIISKVSKLLPKQYFPSGKDLETSIEIQADQSEKNSIQNHFNSNEDQMGNKERSYKGLIFFQEESDLYLIYEGNRKQNDCQPLI